MDLADRDSARDERHAVPGGDGEGWTEVGAAVVRADGPRFRHEVDAPAAALLAGCRGDLPFAHDRPADALVTVALPAVHELVRHGLLVPADGTGA